jgi:hypothetical protein
MSLRTLGLAMTLTLLAADSVWAQDVAVFPVQGTNLNEGELAAIGSLLASAYAEQSKQRVLSPNDVSASLMRTQSERDSALELGLSEYIHVEAVRLMSRITLHASLRNKHGSELFQVRTTAISLDDMEVVSERLAAALYRRTPIENTRTLDNVIGKETKAPNRMFLEKIFGGRFAMVVPLAYHLDARATMLIQFDARLEQKDYFLELGLGVLVPNSLQDKPSVGGLVGELGASYYLAHASVSPYIGAGLSPRIVLGGFSGAGMAVNGHVGLMFMRESSTRLYVEFQVDQNLISFSPSSSYYSDYSYSSSTVAAPRKNVLPTELSLAVGLGF